MIPRVYITQALGQDCSLQLEDEQFHYIKNVIRLPSGAPILLFNGTDGEWQAHIDTYSKKTASIVCSKMTRAQTSTNPLTLMCSLIKPSRLEILIEKATELGVSHIEPLASDHCSYRKINTERLNSHAIEAAEQSERLTIPIIHHVQSLREAIQNHQGEILWADETRDQAGSLFDTLNNHKITALLVGPEGGFSQKEKEFLRAQPKVHPIHMGKLILRAETAGIALISAYQTYSGAWR